jgi:hypothetical protein
MQVVPAIAAGLLLLVDPWEIRAYERGGLAWSTGRLGIEGLAVNALNQEKAVVLCEAADDDFSELTLDLNTGQLIG